MSIQTATEEYTLALRQGQKEYKELTAAGQEAYPLVLDELLPDRTVCSTQEIGLVEIPADRIIGTKSAGRTSAFSASFLPLLGLDSEFAKKWIALCADHLSDTGIRDPIVCYEYLGNFYVQEGNKRVSVLRYFGAARIPGNVIRIVPPVSDDPRVKAYYEFMDFYKSSKLYTIQFRAPGDYTKLLRHLGKKADELWTDKDRKTFNAYFHYFREAFDALNTKLADVLPEEALLLWLKLYPFEDLGKLSGAELKKTLASLWDDVLSTAKPDSVKVQTKAEEGPKGNIFTRLITVTPDHLNVAFVHQLESSVSAWVMGHEEGRKHLEQVMGDKVTARSYFNANNPETAEQLLEQAVAEGAQVVFTTTPLLSRVTLKMAVKYPKIRFLNCSVDQPYSSIRTYYGRIYEAKFITGAIAGAMAQDNRIGYIASYPIFGVPASINAFALGAQLTNPRAQIELHWSCCPGTHQADLFRDGIRVISNRDVPTQNRMYMEFCNYGTYLMEDRGGLVPLGSPVWLWGKFYEHVIKAIQSGTWKDDKNAAAPVNYWLGMDSGLIDISLSDRLPAGVRTLATMLREGLISGNVDPFFRKIVSQDGKLRNDGSRKFTPDELLHMDWLCDNVIGDIPTFDQIQPVSQAMVRELGIYRDQILSEKEGSGDENFDHIR